MINANQSIVTMINSPVRRIGARAELYNGNALVAVFNHTDALQEFTIDRVGEDSKFFGFGVCQKLNVKLIDTARALDITTAHTFKIAFVVYGELVYCYPAFKVTEVHRDENTNALSVTAYDAIYDANKSAFIDLGLGASYTLLDVATACANELGLTLSVGADLLPAFAFNSDIGANTNGYDIGVRDILDDIAEATQTIYYINGNALTFRRLDRDGDAVLTIGKDKYFALDSESNRRLTTIVSATELGDNVSATTGQIGTTQYVRDNIFWGVEMAQYPLLPAEYQKVAYIESTGVNNIDTDIAITTELKSTLKIVAKNTWENRDYWQLDGYGDNSTCCYIGMAYGGFLYFGNNGDVRTNKQLTAEEIANFHTYTLDFKNGEFYFDDERIATFATVGGTGQNYSLFGNGNYNSNRKIARYQFYSNDELFADFIPCYRKTDGAIGFYDVIRQRFFSNGEGFLKGAVEPTTTAEIVENALANVGGLTMAQFNCTWRGNFLLEIGDKIGLVTKDGERVTSYILNDVITYNGFLSESTQWSYTDNGGESLDNPSTLGEALKQTYARVDKQNKRIDLLASESAENKTNITQLQIDTESAKITISQEIADAKNKVVTETGYTFDAEGLTVSKTGSEITTTIAEDGMKVYRGRKAVLTANNEGVNATDLHATTYLIIGKNSRLEDYNSNRTACFWIGG